MIRPVNWQPYEEGLIGILAQNGLKCDRIAHELNLVNSQLKRPYRTVKAVQNRLEKMGVYRNGRLG